MHITRVETLCLSRPHEPERQWFTARYRTIKADGAIVIIHTDGGLIGIGEASPYGVLALIREWVNWLAVELIGRDPADPTLAPHPNGPVSPQYASLPFSPHDCAAAALDTALWDLRGKLSGKTVRALLAAEPRNRVRLYASSGCRYAWNARPEQLIDETLGYMSQGYTACKVRIGTDWAWDGVTAGRFLELMQALHATVAGRMDLMVDGNKRLTVEQSFEVARGLDRLGFAWFEEPFSLEDIDAYAELSASVSLPITGGEQFTTLEQFKPYLEKHALSIVQPDVACCGLTEALRIARMAERYGVDLCPHNWQNGLMTLANAQLVAAIPNTRILELCMIQGPLQWGILAAPPVIRDGQLELPDRPGLGVELANDLEARFPYIDGHYAVPIER
jgi:L-alanine-DL-glutamate epimerase-like enolase superfamily enzyme